MVYKYLRLLLCAATLLLSSCYHMRVEPEGIKPSTVVVRQTPAEALRRIRRVLEEELNLRIIEEQGQGDVLVTVPLHFATDTGFGQPAGGRKYYSQFQIAVKAEQGRTVVTVTPYHYEIRTTYAYGLEGQVRTLNKHYPYEEYPGMFDIQPLVVQLRHLADSFERACNND